MLALGTLAPEFRLPGTDGKTYSLADFRDARALVVAFICNHCPYVIHVRGELAKFGREMQERGVGVVAINANDASSYPQDSPAAMVREVATAGYSFPYLYDESQEVARAYQAACTPDFFLFDGARKLVYRGQFDSSRPGNGAPVTGKDLREAVDAVLTGGAISANQRPSLGCNIKWRRE